MSTSFLASSMPADPPSFSIQPLFGLVRTRFASLLWRDMTVPQATQELRPISAEVWTLPCELLVHVGSFLPVCNIAALSAAFHTAHVHIWNCHELWHCLAERQCLNIGHHQMPPFDLNGLGGITLAAELREAFRRRRFHLDGARLRLLAAQLRLGSNQKAVLEEVTLMTRGLMPRDGHTLAEELCAVAEQALDSHDVICDRTAQAADTLIQLARADDVMFTDAMVEQLEQACCSARQLHALMASSLQQHWAQSIQDLERSFWAQAEEELRELEKDD
mmetsp:Transcript_8544/g.16145  ORF Transcript_8544/g.16145 Transcript_8544/m.16145 type:complete len:276 (+) Transcript_8544:67-894(+)|eukprot:CAMPEP_0172676936 /NCGR_PEP_ID=MMETSP1074-20121228/14328_1 /TAXON_ID=2916 /ORGANISM="Ceratium fusus, Strain PA161109" /LENGTH=275 /DNA_ID=CAMNT_0013494693 /DNA_START=63 /DNA_END=890 /DNA_ORIENTATION=-